MHGPNVGRLQLSVRPETGEERILWSKEGDQKNVWHRQYLVVENSSMHGPYNVIFQGSIQKDGGDIALDDVVFTYNCKLQSDEPNTTPTTPPPEEITSCNFEDEQLCGWRLDLELNETERFHFERKSGNEMLAGFLPNADHNGDKEGKIIFRLRSTFKKIIFSTFYVG